MCLLCNKLQGGKIRRHAKTGRSTLPSVIASIDISLHALSLLTHRDKSHLSKKGGRGPGVSHNFCTNVTIVHHFSTGRQWSLKLKDIIMKVQ